MRAESEVELVLSPRPCPTCGVRSDQVFCQSNIDTTRLDRFAFASRKLPEYMHHRMVICESCELLYADPSPSAESLGQLYHTADFDSGGEAQCASLTYAHHLSAILPRLPDRVGALDVGTGTGDFLGHLLDAGFSGVQGIEPSEQPILHAVERVRPLIRHDIFRPEQFRPNSLSLVSCFQTLEHLADPGAFCRNVHGLLKPGGAGFFVVHNRRALSAKVLGKKSPIFDVEHLQLFCKESVISLLKQAGFDTINVEPLWNSYPLYYWARLFPFPRLVKKPITALLSRAALREIRLSLPAGNLIVVAYKKLACS